MVALRLFVIGLLNTSILLYAENSTNSSSTSSSSAQMIITSPEKSASTTTLVVSPTSASVTVPLPPTETTTVNATTVGNTSMSSAGGSSTLRNCKKIKARESYSEFWDEQKIETKRNNFESVFIAEIITMAIGAMLTLVAIVIMCKDGYCLTQDEQDEAALEAKIEEQTALEERATAIAFEEDD